VSAAGPTLGWVRAVEDESRLVKLSEIVVSDANPRQVFDQAKLQALAASIKETGVLQSLLLRRLPGDVLELVAGERRYRAAQLAGLTEVPALIRTISDADAAIARLEENAKREDLTAIEEGEAYRRALRPLEQGGTGLTQVQLARRLGVSQPHIANRMRLLELPTAWQQRVLDRTLDPTRARDLVKLAKSPTILDDLARTLDDDSDLSAADWEEAVRSSITHHGRPISLTAVWPQKAGRKFADDVLDAHRKSLQIVDSGAGEFALNVELWDELQQAAEKAAQPAAGKGKGKTVTAPNVSQLSARVKQQQAALDRERKLRDYRAAWQRARIAERMEAADKQLYVDDEELTSLLLWLSCQMQGSTWRADTLLKLLGDGPAFSSVEQFRRLVTRRAVHGCDLARRALVVWLRTPLCGFDSDVIDAWAVWLEIDFAVDWRPDRAFFDLLTVSDLAGIAREWGCKTSPKETRETLTTTLLGWEDYSFSRLWRLLMPQEQES
jgi:ParB family chromosome partitioning protein